MKTFLIFLSIIISTTLSAQITKVSLQASGLTCSMCSNSINKAIRSLDFVDKLDANIKTSTFEITFKPAANVDFDKIKRKVEDAGFSVARFVATIHFNKIQVKPNEQITVANKTFKLLNVKDNLLNGDRQVRIIDKGFVSIKEFRKNPIPGSATGTRIYNVTIS